MSYDILNIGDRQLEPPVMPKMDIDWYSCECGCGELYRLHHTYECQECFMIIANEHREIHNTICEANQ